MEREKQEKKRKKTMKTHQNFNENTTNIIEKIDEVNPMISRNVTNSEQNESYRPSQYVGAHLTSHTRMTYFDHCW